MKNMLKSSLVLISLFFNTIITAQGINLIDSLYFSNNAGKNYILYVKEDKVSTNRVVEIYCIAKNRKLFISQNRALIPCEQCGGMRGDPYIAIAKNRNHGFTIYLDNNQIEFKPRGNNFILISSQFTQILNDEIRKGNKKIKTKTIFYTPKKIIFFNDYSIKVLDKNCLKKIIVNENP